MSTQLTKQETLKLEDVKALFFDEFALREPTYRVRKIEQNNNRYYCAKDSTGAWVKANNGSFFYQSVTTFIKNSQPTPIGLQKWYAQLGWERAQYESNRAAKYGTLMHKVFGQFMIEKKLDLFLLPEIVHEEVLLCGYGVEVESLWLENLQSDVLAFAQFIADYEVSPIGIEVVLISPKLGIAGAIDLFCEMNDKCYTDKTEEEKRKRIKAIVDFKSGRNGFHDDYEVQLEAYKELWVENFDIVPDKLFNFSPTEWRKSPDYKLKDQTGSVNTELLKHFISIAEIKGENRKPKFTEYVGIVEFGKAPVDNFVVLGEDELTKKLFEQ